MSPVLAARKWNTPQRLWASLYLIWALDALLLIAAIVGAQVHRDAMKGVGRDTAPSIIAAQHIKSAMADMDANAANELLGEPGKMPEAVAAYEKRRVEAATSLIEAAKNITYGDEERKPIEAIQVGLGAFEGRIQQARDLHEWNDAGFVNAYREAAKLMDGTLLPQADQLDKANHQHLEETYAAVSGMSVATVVFMLLAGTALVWALVAVQNFLTRRTRRILNPMLVMATLVTLGFILYTFTTLGSERHRLTVAKEDAFDSIHALWRARAVSYAANADESRYLLDAAHAREHESAFFGKAGSLIEVPQGVSFAHARESARRGHTKDLKGYLADELNNITFEGERDAAVETLVNFGEYLRIDGMIRQLEHSKKHAEAIELCIGTKTGESNWAFDQFDQALGKTLEINQKNFDLAVERGFGALSYFELKASIVAVAIALLAFGGLLKRIAEYR